MNFKIRTLLKIAMGSVAVLYPVVIFLSFVVFDVPLDYLSILIVVFGVLYLILNLTNEEKKKSAQTFISPVMLILIGTAGVVLNSSDKTKEVIKLYPLLVNCGWLIVFVLSVFFPPNIVYEIASLFDRSIREPDVKPYLLRFGRRATIAWSVFFAIDVVLAWFTIFGPQTAVQSEHLTDTIWGIYNGAVTYIAMGIITMIQILMAKKIIRQHRG